MTETSLFLLTVLVIENLLLVLLIYLWINRHCFKCEKVKCLERVFNRTCSKCKPKSKTIQL
ncbi:MAG: hypothetical protein I3273_03770 [Candidatus Moeniiplasma glomeromycotorum]|nr:hypothetical protein [Candidatus Moeniiplasma glomeromycotorum]MCE8169214.1 hypothetical protein [Candidatus Moeniiplasma glomeromycotorum]